MTRIGTAPLMTEASVESTRCSAQVISVNGITMLTTAMTSRWPVRGPVARQMLPGGGHDRGQQREAEEESERDQRERRQAGIHADLDEHVAAAPQEAEDDEQQPVDTGAGGDHGDIVTYRWPHG